MERYERKISKLQFLKLGGSLITDKNSPSTPQLYILEHIAREIANAFNENPDLKIILGHGAGSFGHVPAKKYGTKKGVSTLSEWHGFSQVWFQASILNHLVIETLQSQGLPAVSFPPSASATTLDGRITSWDLSPILTALKAGLLPVVQGDVVFDTTLGGTILSTEDVFAHLAQEMRPSCILIAGIEPGVWADFPFCTNILEEITPGIFNEIFPTLGESTSIDVTGGMSSKVKGMLSLVERYPELKVIIFSGKKPETIKDALLGDTYGTHIHA
jgi:isopentenyl phosphate kinase